MLKNILYTGILRSSDTYSPVQENLRIIDDKTFGGVKDMLEIRSHKHQDTRSAPLNTRGRSLLAGNIFCGHCGARLCITTSGKGRPNADGTDTIRMRYTCQTKSRKHDVCSGQTGYTVSKVDKIVDAFICEIFQKVHSLEKKEILQAKYDRDVIMYKEHWHALSRDYEKANVELKRLQDEIAKALTGDSLFSPEMLSTAIRKQADKCEAISKSLALAETEMNSGEHHFRELSEQFDDMLSWVDVYFGADIGTKKMIVSHLIDRVDVSKDYDITITLKISVEQFLETIEVCA